MLAYEDVDEGLIPGITTNFLFQLTLGKTLSLETTVFSFSLSLSLSRSLSLLNLWENIVLRLHLKNAQSQIRRWFH